MQRIITNDSCKLYHTKYCDLLNMQTCDTCFVKKSDDVEQVLADLDVLQSLLPQEPLHHLFAGEECQLCKQEENKGRRAYYGFVDMGHPEPKRTKRSVIGLKVKTDVGSMVPLQIGACSQCRRRMLVLEYVPILIPVLAGLTVLLLLIVPGISDGLERIAQIMPFVLFAGVILVSFVVAAIIKRMLTKKYSQLTRMNIFEIPLVQKMKELGWFPLGKSGNTVKVVFSRKRMRAGVCTGTPAEATATQEPA